MAKGKEYLYLASQVDIPTGEKPDRPGDPPPIKRVGPGLLSELDISDKEIERLPRGVVRNATADEIEAGASRATAAKAAQVAAEQREQEESQRIEQENERRALETKLQQERDEQLRELEEKQDTERAKQREAAAEEINAATGAGSGGKKKGSRK